MEKTTILFYTSHSGSTEQYARWIAEDCGITVCKRIDEYSQDLVKKYDRVIFGSYVKMGRVFLQDFLVSHFNEFSHKELFMFTVGLVPLTSAEGQKSWNAIPSYIRDTIVYHEKFSGKIDHQKINFFDRVIVALIGRKFDSTFGHDEIIKFVISVRENRDIHIAEFL